MCSRFLFSQFYRYIFKPLVFQMDAEAVHEHTAKFGEILGKNKGGRALLQAIMGRPQLSLARTLNGITFPTPIGLSAGFDYEAKLMDITPSLGFGFHTIGTITNHPYMGNPKPRLGRLPKSQSLLVNKGFKNPGVDAILKKLKGKHFAIPIGISIGRTNDPSLTQEGSVNDICEAFSKCEKTQVSINYYELNISCPNLFGTVSFYDQTNLEKLLKAIDQLKLKKPLFVKMPISQPNDIFLELLKVIDKHSPVGIIIGNLQQDRANDAFDQEEIKKATKGNFSGRPTFVRSNELIALARKEYPKRFTIIGCGGIFSPADAQTKLSSGADLIQLITGMIFTGPQLIMDIDDQLTKN